MSDDIMKLFASLGVGGVLAGVIFYFYHQRVSADLLQAGRMLESEQRRSDALFSVVKENTASNVAVVKSVEALAHLVESLYHREFDDNEGRRHFLRIPPKP